MEKPRIQDDLYTYVNQEKLDSLVIPDDKPCVGGFQTLAEDVEKIMLKEFNDICTINTYTNFICICNRFLLILFVCQFILKGV